SRHPACEPQFESSATRTALSYDHVPDAGIRHESQPVNRNTAGELAGRLEYKVHQLGIAGKKENGFKKAARGMGGRHRFDLVLGSLGEPVESGEGSAQVLRG